MESVDRMAKIVRADPSITVRDLAREMGFQETRSIYYWLEKARFDGLKEFKRAILSQREATLVKADSPSGLPPEGSFFRLPTARGFSSDGKIVWDDGCFEVVLPFHATHSTFALKETPDRVLAAGSNEAWLVVDSAEPVRDRATVLLLGPDDTAVAARAICFGSVCRYVLLTGDEAGPDFSVIGPIKARIEFFG